MNSLVFVYIITGIASIIIAFLLIHLARLSSQAGLKIEEEEKQAGFSEAPFSLEGELQESLFNEINEVVRSKQRSQDITRIVAGILDDEINKKVSKANQDLTQKYETVIKEKSQNEELAWKKYKKVAEYKKNTEAVIRSIAEGLVVVDSSGKVLMMNPAAEKLLGINKKEKIGKPLTEDLKDEQLVSFMKSAPEAENKEIELVSAKDETKKTLRASSAVVEDENGQTVGVVSVLSDITKQKELDQFKANFIANVSHELRTPLVSIDKSIALILNNAVGEVTTPQREFLSIAQRNIKRLSLLINDLLDLSKLEAGRMIVKREPANIVSVINESIDGVENWAKTKGITLERKIQEGLLPVTIDSNKIIQVLNNLIGNAIKFTPNSGRITVEVKLSGSDQIAVSVHDNGIGINKEDLPKVFDKFYQAGERISTDIQGTGIGLAIAREIVELHGGKIWAESEKGEGATFIFTLSVTNVTTGA